MPTLSRRLPTVLLTALAAAVLALAATPTTALAAPVAPARVAADLTATIRLSNCSASLVRYPTSLASDQAMMLTNGHCFEGGFLAAGQVITNRASARRGTLLSSSGSSLLSVTADRVLYATMTGTDVLLYRLTRTYASIQAATGVTARTIASSHPAPEDTFVPSGYFARVFNCDVLTFVPTLREDRWTWHDSIRFADGCATIPGTSGSPIISVATGALVGINNTSNENGQSCTLDNPCEVAGDGSVTVVQGRRYGQQTYWFTTCLTTGRTIDVNLAGCLLPRPTV